MVRSHQGSTPQVTTGCSDQDWRHPSRVSITHVLASVFIHCYGRPLSTKSADFLIHKDTSNRVTVWGICPCQDKNSS